MKRKKTQVLHSFKYLTSEKRDEENKKYRSIYECLPHVVIPTAC